MSNEGTVTTVNDSRHYIRIGNKVVKNEPMPERNIKVFGHYTNLDRNGELFIKEVDNAMKFDLVSPENLSVFLDEHVCDDNLRTKIDGYINEIKAIQDPKDYKKMYDSTNDPIFKRLLGVYVRGEIKKAIVDFETTIKDNKITSFEQQLNLVKHGYYYDKDGNKVEVAKPSDRNYYQKEAAKAFENSVIPGEKEIRMLAIVKKLEEDGSLDEVDKKKDVREVIVAKAEELYGKDAEFEKYVNSRKDIQKLELRRSDVVQRREELKHISMDEMKKELKQGTIDAISCYLEKHVVEEKDGVKYYDLTALSDAIHEGSGADYRVNKNNTIRPYCEIESARREIITDDIADFLLFDKAGDRKYTKDLIKFCDYKITGRNHKMSLLGTAQQVGAGVLGGLIGFLASNRDVRVHVLDENNTTVNIGGLGTISTTTNLESLAEITIGEIAEAAGWGAVGGLGLALVNGIIGTAPSEDVCDDISYVVKHKNEFKDWQTCLDTRIKVHPEKADFIKREMTAYPPKEDGTWDIDKYIQDKYAAAGNAIQNPDECLGTRLQNAPEVEEPAEVKPTMIATVEETEHVEKVRNTDDLFNKKANKTTWSRLVDLYSCDDNNSLLVKCGGNRNKAIRILKLIQALDNDNYTFEELETMYKISIIKDPTIREQQLKAIKGLDYDKYIEVRNASLMPDELWLPAKIGDIERCEINRETELELLPLKDEIEDKSGKVKSNGPVQHFNENPVKTETAKVAVIDANGDVALQYTLPNREIANDSLNVLNNRYGLGLDPDGIEELFTTPENFENTLKKDEK